jgi:hypothetical protein
MDRLVRRITVAGQALARITLHLGFYFQGQKMNDIQKNERVRLWISYPWLDRQEKDFTCLLSELNAEHIEVVYDSVELLPDVHLRERIIQRLLSIGFDGWLYILTYQCITRRRCANELTEAIDQALLNMGLGFPIMGLLYGVADYQMPPRLRMQPCISLSTPDWTHQISKVLRSRSLQERRRVLPGEGRFDWKIHRCYCDDPSKTAIEVSSKEGMVQYWRFAIPGSAQAIQWGQGPRGGREMSHIRFAEASGSGRYRNREVAWFGAANTVSDTESAYAVFSGPLPEFICFGSVTSPFGPPRRMEIFYPSLADKANVV